MALKNKKSAKTKSQKAAVVKKKSVKKETSKPAPKLKAKKPVAKAKTAAKKVNPSKKEIKKPVAPKSKPVAKKQPVKPAAPKAAVKKSEVSKQPVKTPLPKKNETALATKANAAEAQKVVKTGIKTKKQLLSAPAQPVIEVSNWPKNKIRTILISQPKPVENDKNPYVELARKYNLRATFRQFIRIEGLSARDFRTQRVDILEHHAVILTSRLAVDHFFRMCNEMRVTVPESMKYFCINEATAYYLQKYIQYRKRKIFFGHQTIQDLVDVIKKNRDEKFLLPVSDVHKEQIQGFLDELSIKYTKAVMYRTVSADLSDIKDLKEYDLLVFFTPAGIRSLKHNFPGFKQADTRLGCFGAATANELKKQGYRLDIYAPNPKNPSMSGAIDEYLKESNKR